MNYSKKKINRIFKKHKFDYEESDSIPKDIYEEVVNTLLNQLSNSKKNIGILENINNHSNTEIKDYIKNLEEAKAQLALSSKMAGIGEMASSISHEINNNLAGISLNYQQLKYLLKMKEVEDENINDCLDRSHNSIKKVSHIIMGIKRISSKSSEEFDFERLDISKIIKETSSFGQGDFNKLGIKYTESVPEELFASVDEIYFAQVVLNLLTNAKQAVECLDIEEKWIHIDYEAKDSLHVLKISNGGEQIPEAIQDKIFESFFTTKKVGEGTGIGLHISSKIMKQFKGDLYLDKQAQNPCFVIEIPRC